MALLTSYLLTDLLILVATVLTSVYLYFQHRFRYWSKKNVAHTQPSFPLGDLKGMGTEHSIGPLFQNIYDKYKNHKVVGVWMMATPTLVVNDVNLVKNVLVKDFNHFHDRGFDVDEELEPLAGHLFTMNGQKWRNLRIKLAPTFTSGRMKMMFPTMITVGEELVRVLNESVGDPDGVEVREMMGRYTTDVIASCAFGIEVSSLKNPDSEFRKMSKALNTRTVIEILGMWLTFIFPQAIRILRLHMIPKQVTKFFMAVVKDTMEYREKNDVKRNDFFQLLIQLKNKGFVEDADADADIGMDDRNTYDFTMEQAAAQAFVFLVAGFETSSSTMQFALYEVALKPELQAKLQKEVDAVVKKYNGQLTYEGIQEMTLLDQTVAETLRKYPIAPVLLRECTKDYTIPETNIVIEKGTRVIIPTLGIQRDPDIYPEPERFDPDRFSPEEKEKRDRYAYLPFGEGPRICIGNRFGLTQTKVGLALIFKNFNLVVCKKTPIPFSLDPKIDTLTPKETIYLKVEKRT
uniref:Cytochrome P450 n=1 Tax=Liposcelis entomophila TaxID=550478 RepID=A0A0U4GH49_9NEOP|nr:cytochrome P450 [Liposcelis entomophila]